MDFVSQVQEKGVVGAGGAGFPSHIKLKAKAEIVLVNAAECEPLLHKDKQILEHFWQPFFAGLLYAVEAVSAEKGIIGIKRKHKKLIEKLRTQLPEKVELCPVDDFYPAGDEITLIKETTGRVVAPGQLPLSQGVVVMNVETLYNIGIDGPVTHTFVNLGGAVENRHTLKVPLGLPYKELLDYARPTIGNYAVIDGGPMMGKMLEEITDQVVTKTSSALLVFPKDHHLINRHRHSGSMPTVNEIGKSACDQCGFCTELCPRYLLGHPIQPHKAMRSLLFQNADEANPQPEAHTLYCCQCNLCSMVSCPEGLYPSQVCIDNRQRSIAQKVKYEGPLDSPPHPLAEYRKTPSKKLKQMLDISSYPDEGPLVEKTFAVKFLRIKLQQHIGAPASPLVTTGDMVQCGQKIASAGENLGSEIHAPAAGEIAEIRNDEIVIKIGRQQSAL